MSQALPASNNTFIPQFDASGKLITAFSRNPKDFALNQWATITPVKKSIGYYLRINPEQAARIISSDRREFLWHDGNDAPEHSWGTEAFEFFPYATERLSFGFRMGYKSIDQADWQIVASHAAITAQQAMTMRAVYALTKLTTGGNWSGHTDTASNLGGAKFDVGTVAAPSLKSGLLKAASIIHKDTLGVVQPKDLIFVVNPNDARLISKSPELLDAFKQQAGTYGIWTDAPEVRNGKWGLPDYLWGFKVVVDDTVVVTNARGATKATSYALPDASGLLLARPGGLIGQEGAVSFSTFHFFMYEEMTVETRDDPDHRRTKGRVVDDWAGEIVAPVSGYLITAMTG